MKAIEEMGRFDEAQRLMRLAEFQDWFIRRYSEAIEDEDLRDRFRRDSIYMVSLIYREAQEPLVKQLREVIVAQANPLILPLGQPQV